MPAKRTMFDNLKDLAVECRKFSPIWVRYSRFGTDAGVIADVQNALRQGAFVTLRTSIDGSMNVEKLENAQAITAARTSHDHRQVKIGHSRNWFDLCPRDVITISEKPLTTPEVGIDFGAVPDYTPAEQTAAMERVKSV